MKDNLGLDSDFTEELQDYLICNYGMQLLTHKVHFDVTGPSFGPLHELYGELYEYFQEMIDTTGERIRQRGKYPDNTPKAIAKTEYTFPAEPLSPVDQLNLVIESLSKFIIETRGLCGKANVTNDYSMVDWLGSVLTDLEKYLWKLTANITVIDNSKNTESLKLIKV